MTTDTRTAAITAEAHSDDHRVEVAIDATPYLRQASVEDLKSLDACGWRGDYPADAVYHQACAAGDEEAAKLEGYLATDPVMPTDDPVGFEVVCDRDAFLEWLSGNRPETHAALVAAIDDPEP